jgi:hypothetical protein
MLKKKSLTPGLLPLQPGAHFRMTKTRCAAACFAVILSLGVVIAPSVLAARRTTQPNYVTLVPVLLTNSAVKIRADQFTSHGVSTYPRGAIIDFFLKNGGHDPVSVRIKLVGTINFYGHNSIATYTNAGKPIRPGKSRHFKINFFFRSTFAMQMLVGGKVRASTPITVV